MRSLAILLAASSPGSPRKRAQAAANTAPMLAGLDAAAAEVRGRRETDLEFAEVGYMEVKSSALLQSELTAARVHREGGRRRRADGVRRRVRERQAGDRDPR